MSAPGRLVQGEVSFNSNDAGTVYFDVVFTYALDSAPDVKLTKVYTKVEPDDIPGLIADLESSEGVALL